MILILRHSELTQHILVKLQKKSAIDALVAEALCVLAQADGREPPRYVVGVPTIRLQRVRAV